MGEGNGTPLQHSCVENPVEGGAWWAAIHGVAKSQTRLSNFTFTFHFHAMKKEMATHSSVLAWRIPRIGGAWWAAVYGVTQSRTQLTRLSSSSNWQFPSICPEERGKSLPSTLNSVDTAGKYMPSSREKTILRPLNGCFHLCVMYR